MKRALLLLVLCVTLVVSTTRMPVVFAAENNNTNEEQSSQKYGGGYAASNQMQGFGFTAKMFDSTNGMPTSDANYILGSSTDICGLVVIVES